MYNYTASGYTYHLLIPWNPIHIFQIMLLTRLNYLSNPNDLITVIPDCSMVSEEAKNLTDDCCSVKTSMMSSIPQFNCPCVQALRATRWVGFNNGRLEYVLT
jgi:hypothetical protein